MRIIRVRSNLGMWRLTLVEDATSTDGDDNNNNHNMKVSGLIDLLQQQYQDVFENHYFSSPLSMDVRGTQPLNLSQTLTEQGIEHGAIIYCRLKEKIRKSTSSSPSTEMVHGVGMDQQPKSQGDNEKSKRRIAQAIIEGAMAHVVFPSDSTVAKKKPPLSSRSESDFSSKPSSSQCNDVVDLMDSSSDDEEDDYYNAILKECCSEQQDDDDDNDSVQVISPPKNNKPSMVDAFQGHSKPSQHDTTIPLMKRQRRNASDSLKRTTSSESPSSSLKVEKDELQKFQIASYNVWFGPPDPEAGQVYPKERMMAIVECIQTECMSHNQSGVEDNNPLLFIGFQELTPSLVSYLKPILGQIGYKLCTQPLGKTMDSSSYGIGMAVPQSLNIMEHRFIPYSNTRQGRGLLYIKTSTLLLATTHLESWTNHNADGSREREIQLIQAAQFCKEELEDPTSSLQLAVIVGDLNWDDERKQKRSEPSSNHKLLSLLPQGWKDAGKPFDYTYDAKENPMLGGNLRRRFDRCIYYYHHANEEQLLVWECLRLQKVGQSAIPGLTWLKKNPYTGNTKPVPVAPSDHFGLVLSFGKVPPWETTKR